MVTIKNTVRTIPVNIKKLKMDAQKLLDLLGYSDFDLGIWLTTNNTIRKYNRLYRKKDNPTDILSFPNYPNLRPGERINVKTLEEKDLGDIIISLEYGVREAKQLEISLQKWLQQLLVHGVCHLLGYTHDTDEEYKKMQKKETYLLTKLQRG
ncbi:rRNA maturation RNase YbeY [Candidatus Dependentiae bacterium]|nr:MAG: rRNA maturation RNase YbeY [Candidatus Dependentiae bacterium]